MILTVRDSRRGHHFENATFSFDGGRGFPPLPEFFPHPLFHACEFAAGDAAGIAFRWPRVCVVEALGHPARAWFLFLPPYSPDLDPIEMAFAKLKAHLHKAKARTIEVLRRAVGSICELYSSDECRSYLKHAGCIAG